VLGFRGFLTDPRRSKSRNRRRVHVRRVAGCFGRGGAPDRGGDALDEIEVVAPGERLVFGTNPCPFTITETYSANGLSLTTKSPGSALLTIDPTTGEIIITVASIRMYCKRHTACTANVMHQGTSRLVT
jgi:hypothetical protein